MLDEICCSHWFFPFDLALECLKILANNLVILLRNIKKMAVSKLMDHIKVEYITFQTFTVHTFMYYVNISFQHSCHNFLKPFNNMSTSISCLLPFRFKSTSITVIVYFTTLSLLFFIYSYQKGNFNGFYFLNF